MVRYATIGSSWIADAFIEAAKQSAPDLVLTAVYSRTRERGLEFGAKYGVDRVYTSLEELAAAEDIDAVYIASPNVMHYPQAKLLLAAGKHVMCEKTCVVTTAQLDDLLSIAAEQGVVFMEAIKLMHMPVLKQVEEYLPKLGRIHLCKFDFSRYSSKYPKYLAGETPNIFRRDLCAGGLMDMGVYSIYPAVYFFGEPLTVDAHAIFMNTGADGAGAALLGYADNAVTVGWSKMSEHYQWNTIQGDNGILVIDTIEHMDNVDFIDVKGNREHLFSRDTERKVMSWEAEAFYRWITDPIGSAEEAARITEVTRGTIRTIERIRAAAGIRFDV